ncbi:hypothetical protein LCGC14_1020460 [marine sediment metagenome]|uniref:Glycosyltransferase 2-like domain-containing protein n=1 Tax=marine sediment metagenome TaxID=412755 RepID=A0A0F9QFN4_9ZZZZ
MTGCTVILPTRNEVKTIGSMIDEILCLSLDLDLQVLVADYKSTDGTIEKVLEYEGDDPVFLLSCSKKGKAAGIKEALQHIETPLVIVVNADNTYPVKFVGLMYRILELGYDGVMGPRMLKGPGSMSILHSVGNYGLSLLASVLFFYWVFDVNTGLWGYKTEVIRKFNLNSSGFCLEADVFSNAVMAGCRVMQMPIEYQARVEGSNAELGVWDGFKIAWFLIRRRLGWV